MPISITYLEDGGIIAKGEGIVTGSEIKEINDTIYESPEKIKKIVYQICDWTNVSDVSISTPEIEAIASQDKQAADINPNMFIALVTKKDFFFGLARMWEAFAYSSPIETGIFRKMEDAQQWISEKLQKRERKEDHPLKDTG